VTWKNERGFGKGKLRLVRGREGEGNAQGSCTRGDWEGKGRRRKSHCQDVETVTGVLPGNVGKQTVSGGVLGNMRVGRNRFRGTLTLDTKYQVRRGNSICDEGKPAPENRRE